MNANGLGRDSKKKTHGDFLCTKCTGEGECLRSLRKVVDMNGGKRRMVEKASIPQNASETKPISKAIAAAASPVAILQKPKNTKDAADELLARSECKLKGRTPVQKLADSGHLKNGGGNFSSHHQKYIFPTSGSDVRLSSQSCKNMVEFQEGPTGLPVVCSSVQVDEMRMGSTYSSLSPPPSCLPLPKFSLRQLKPSYVDMSSCKQDGLISQGDPKRGGLMSTSRTPCCESVFCGDKKEVDLVFATKDLRRILNLDSC